jgi:hypothetical protein
MAYLNARTKVKSVFGEYAIEENKTDVTLTESPGSIYDYLVRDGGRQGLQSKIMLASTNIDAISDGVAFITKKQKDLVRIVGLLKTDVKGIFERYLNRNLPIKEAREKTRRDLDEKFLKLMKEHEEDYPKATLDKVITKLVGK